MLSWPNHCTLWASSCWRTNDWNSYYFVKLVRWKNNNNNNNPNASNVRWLDFEISAKWQIWLSENLSSFLSRLHLTNFSSDWQKKGGQKIYIRTEKLISLVYNINYYLIVPIDRALQRLYLLFYSYNWHNNWCKLDHIRKVCWNLGSKSFFTTYHIETTVSSFMIGRRN